MTIETVLTILLLDLITLPLPHAYFNSIRGILKLSLASNFFLNFKRYFIVGIYCLQETKSQHTGIVKLSHTHFYLSGTADDPYAGVGFAVYNPLTHPVPTNFSYHSHTLSSPHASPRLFASPILALWYKYLGHIIRHPASPEFHMCFNNSLSLRTISSPFRRGAPRAHWPEIAFAESAHVLQRNINPPVLGFFLHQFFTHFAIVELKTFSAASMKQWYNTTRFVHLLFPVAENREQCKFLTPKMK